MVELLYIDQVKKVAAFWEKSEWWLFIVVEATKRKLSRDRDTVKSLSDNNLNFKSGRKDPRPYDTLLLRISSDRFSGITISLLCSLPKKQKVRELL